MISEPMPEDLLTRMGYESSAFEVIWVDLRRETILDFFRFITELRQSRS